jgi:hypothetical protein
MRAMYFMMKEIIRGPGRRCARVTDSPQNTSHLESDADGLSGQGGPVGTTRTEVLYAISISFRNSLDLILLRNSI